MRHKQEVINDILNSGTAVLKGTVRPDNAKHSQIDKWDIWNGINYLVESKVKWNPLTENPPYTISNCSIYLMTEVLTKEGQ